MSITDSSIPRLREGISPLLPLGSVLVRSGVLCGEGPLSYLGFGSSLLPESMKGPRASWANELARSWGGRAGCDSAMTAHP